MGNPSWGHGYHKGSVDGFNAGFGEGAKAGGVGGVLGGILLGLGLPWVYNKIKDWRIKKHEAKLMAEESLLVEEENEEN